MGMTVSKKNMFFEILKTDRISLCLFCVNSLYSSIIARGFQMTVVELLVWTYRYLYVSMVINAGSSSNSDQGPVSRKFRNFSGAFRVT